MRLSHSELLRSIRNLKRKSILRTISEKALLESEQKFWTKIFEFASDALFILDLQGNFHRCQPDRLRASWIHKSGCCRDMCPNSIRQSTPQRSPGAACKAGWAVFKSARACEERRDLMPVEINAKIITLGERKVVFSGIRIRARAGGGSAQANECQTSYLDPGHSRHGVLQECQRTALDREQSS